MELFKNKQPSISTVEAGMRYNAPPPSFILSKVFFEYLPFANMMFFSTTLPDMVKIRDSPFASMVWPLPSMIKSVSISIPSP